MQNQNNNELDALDQLAEELKSHVVVDGGRVIRYYNSDNQLHRINGPAAIYPNGTEFWCQNGEYHRKDGPALNWYNGAKEWYQNDKPHRLDGPAVIWPNGDRFWYIDGIRYPEERFNAHPDVIAYAKSKQQ